MLFLLIFKLLLEYLEKNNWVKKSARTLRVKINILIQNI